MNTITIAEIKRGGMAALDAVLNMPQHGGTATIMKRNRPAAVVLTPQVYAALLVNADEHKRSGKALDWLLAAHNISQSELQTNELDANGMAQRLNDLRSEWSLR